MRLPARFAMLPVAALLVSATPADLMIPMPNTSDWTLVIPAGSPVSFRRFGEYGVARFNGRFVLNGKFSYGCSIECEGKLQDSQLELVVYPDPESTSLLPRVKDRGGDMAIYIRNGSRPAHVLSTRQQRAALRSGQISHLQGRIEIVVDDLEISGDCDSVFYSARFVSFAKASRKLAVAASSGGAGCG